MLFSAYKAFPYVADYYSYTIITSADGTVSEKRYSTIPVQIKMQASSSYIGDLIISTDAKLQKDGKISNLRDKNGAEIYQDGVWQISQTQPRTNSLGLVEGYRYKARIISGDI
jgi:hypothetical protein